MKQLLIALIASLAFILPISAQEGGGFLERIAKLEAAQAQTNAKLDTVSQQQTALAQKIDALSIKVDMLKPVSADVQPPYPAPSGFHWNRCYQSQANGYCLADAAGNRWAWKETIGWVQLPPYSVSADACADGSCATLVGPYTLGCNNQGCASGACGAGGCGAAATYGSPVMTSSRGGIFRGGFFRRGGRRGGCGG